MLNLRCANYSYDLSDHENFRALEHSCGGWGTGAYSAWQSTYHHYHSVRHFGVSSPALPSSTTQGEPRLCRSQRSLLRAGWPNTGGGWDPLAVERRNVRSSSFPTCSLFVESPRLVHPSVLMQAWRGKSNTWIFRGVKRDSRKRTRICIALAAGRDTGIAGCASPINPRGESAPRPS